MNFDGFVIWWYWWLSYYLSSPSAPLLPLPSSSPRQRCWGQRVEWGPATLWYVADRDLTFTSLYNRLYSIIAIYHDTRHHFCNRFWHHHTQLTPPFTFTKSWLEKLAVTCKILIYLEVCQKKLEYHQLHKARIFKKKDKMSGSGRAGWADAVGSKRVTAPFSYIVQINSKWIMIINIARGTADSGN